LIEQQADKRKYEVTMKHAHITICNLICVSTSLAMPPGVNPWQEPIIPDPYGQAKTPCERARAHARTFLGGAAIECEADGSYSPVRCELFSSGRDCWCVTDDGKEVEGTRGRFEDTKPDCSAYRKPGVDPEVAAAAAMVASKKAPISDAAGEVAKNPSAVVDQREREKRDLPEELSDQTADCIGRIRFLEDKISSLNKKVFALESLVDSLRTTAQPTGETA